jgi:hypothetical protein
LLSMVGGNHLTSRPFPDPLVGCLGVAAGTLALDACERKHQVICRCLA